VSRRTSVEHRQVPHLETGLSTNPIKLDWSCFGARISGSMPPAGKKFKNFICIDISVKSQASQPWFAIVLAII
jgi:hypothetical protein